MGWNSARFLSFPCHAVLGTFRVYFALLGATGYGWIGPDVRYSAQVGLDVTAALLLQGLLVVDCSSGLPECPVRFCLLLVASCVYCAP